jgi:hypothetical protein
MSLAPKTALHSREAEGKSSQMTEPTSRALLGAALLTISGIGAAFAAAAPPVMTLADLREMCAASDAAGHAACRFFIMGAFQGLSLAGGATQGADGHFNERKAAKTFCVPDDLPQSVMVQKVVSLADADVKVFPADADMPAISFVASVVVHSYPCR